MTSQLMTAEQDELVATVRGLLAKRADSTAVRAAIESPAGYDEGLWRVLCEQIGVAALAVPEQYDGAGATLVEACLVLEELGYSLAPVPALSSLIASQAVLAASPSAAATELLPRIAAGEVATLAFDARSSDGGLVLDADLATLLLAEQPGPDQDGRLVLVDGAEATRVPSMDQTLHLATVDLTRATFTDLAASAAGPLEHARVVALVGIAALQAGAARRGLDLTVAYSKERVQFGRPIGSFQALKHRMADLLVLVEMSRSAYLAAAEAISTRADDAAELAAAAKSYCGDALQQVASETVQLHGGIGVTWEHDAHLVFKRAHALNQLFGQPHQLRAGLTL